MAPITVEQIGKRFVARCSYEQKDIVKAAGFRWDRDGRVWFTNDPAAAAQFSDAGAAQRIMQHLADQQAERADAVVASRANDADIDIPCPEGLAYLPYQRAGIVFALKLFGVLKGGFQSISSVGVLFGDEMG